MPEYKVVNFKFDTVAFSTIVQAAVNSTSGVFVAEVLGVAEPTLETWIRLPVYEREFSFPRMSNFVKFCNYFDHDPRQFWILDE